MDYDEAADRATRQLKRYGLRGMEFERQIGTLRTDLESLEANKYHRAVAALGALLGFDTALPDGAGSPDVGWRHADRITLAFEAKTEEAMDKPLSLDAVRQAATHLAWIQDNLKWPVTQRGEAVIIGHHQRSGDGVTPTVAGDVALVSPDEIMRLLAAAVEMHRSVKAQSTGLSDEQLRELLSESLGAADLRPKAVADRLTKRKVADMPKA